MTRSPDPDVTVALDGSPPQVIGDRYELGDRLGEGGMGVVYKAHDRTLRRTVAIKVFRDGPAQPARASSETELLAGLNHHGLVTLFDAHVSGDTPHYLVMEFVDGPTLQQSLDIGRLSPATVERVARDLADALHSVHEAGIVHRDIKPSNVLLRPSTVPGERFHAKLADFGIAHLVDSTRLTVPGTVIGSAAYLSPEQVTGSPPAPAADIYSLGLVLLEALTGRRAFAQTGVKEAVVVRLTQDPVIPPSVGGDWADLLAAMTARDPALRPSALDVVGTLRRMSPGPGSGDSTTLVFETRHPDHLVPAARPRRRRRLLASPGLAGVAAVVVATILLVVPNTGTPAPPPAVPSVEASPTPSTPAPQASENPVIDPGSTTVTDDGNNGNGNDENNGSNGNNGNNGNGNSGNNGNGNDD